jgi:hypothetical protein
LTFLKNARFSPLNINSVPGQLNGRTPLTNIFLPIPMNFTQGKLEHDFEATSILDTLFAAVEGAVQLTYSQASDSTPMGAIQRLAGMARGGIDIANLVASTNQRIINRGFLVMYKRPLNREFQFTWILHPRNKTEAETLVAICEIMKFCCAASVGSLTLNEAIGNTLIGADGIVSSFDASNLVIQYPNELRMRMLYLDDQGNLKPIFNPEMHFGYVESLQIDHFDEASLPAGFFTGTNYPILTTIQMTVMENRIMFKKHFTRNREFEQAGFQSQEIPTGLLDE